MYTSLFECIYLFTTFLSFWRDSLVIPACLSAVSVVILLLHAVFASAALQKVWKKVFSGTFINENLKQVHVVNVPEGRSGPIIITYNVARLVGCLAVTGLSIASLVSAYSANPAERSPVDLAQCVNMVRFQYSCTKARLMRPHRRAIFPCYLSFL